MNNMNSTLRRTILLLGYVGILGFLLACTAIGIGSSAVQQGMLQLDQGVVKVQDPQGNWEPLAGTSTFELVGKLENTNPWTVAGRTLATNESTQIAQGLQVGDVVRVRGASLEDGTWLAYSIEPAGEQPSQTIILIGKVTSVNPWVINGITLNVTSDTVINGDIQPGMLVRVEILLQDDGTWEVISISPLGEVPTTSGCATVVATIEGVNGTQIKFLGWPEPVTVNTPTSDGNGNDNYSNNVGVDITTLKPGQQVLVVVCVSGNNQLVITTIVIINNNDENDNNNETGGGDKVLVCHKPGKKGGHTLSISSSAVPAHLGHGDKLGACP
jgi:hypothetical protein